MGQWFGTQGRPKVAKISKTFLHCDVTSRNPPPKTKNVFFRFQLGLAESVDGLDSSLALSPGELYDCKALQNAGQKGLKSSSKKNVCSLPRSSQRDLKRHWGGDLEHEP